MWRYSSPHLPSDRNIHAARAAFVRHREKGLLTDAGRRHAPLACDGGQRARTVAQSGAIDLLPKQPLCSLQSSSPPPVMMVQSNSGVRLNDRKQC
jgi:hypothetical protein